MKYFLNKSIADYPKKYILGVQILFPLISDFAVQVKLLII